MKLLHWNEIQNCYDVEENDSRSQYQLNIMQTIKIAHLPSEVNGYKWHYQMERNIECSTFFTRCWPAKMNEKKNSARLNEQLFNANGDRGELESAGKNSRVFSQRCGTASYEEAGTSRSNFYMSTTFNYPPTSTVLLRFHWVSMRMRSKIEC